MTLFNNNCRVLAFVGPVLLASCSYLPDQLNPIDWVDSANDWVTSGIWGDQTSGPDSEARVAGERKMLWRNSFDHPEDRLPFSPAVDLAEACRPRPRSETLTSKEDGGAVATPREGCLQPAMIRTAGP